MKENEKALDIDGKNLITEAIEDVADTLDLSSLNEPTEEKPVKAVTRRESDRTTDALHNRTLAMMESGELSQDEGLTLIRKSAEDGAAVSWLYLGGLCSDEDSAHYNPAQAFECYSRAAEIGESEGYYRKGLCYASGFGCDKDEKTAVDCFMSAARMGNADALCSLGICREFGIGCDINYSMAVGFYMRAADNGSITAINNLGGCYFYGHGVSADKEKAIGLFTRAASLGSAAAECRLGICRESGEGCEKDEAIAFEHYTKAAEAGNATALYRLAMCYDKGIGTEQNFAGAFKYYEKAAALGCAEAMYESGMMSKSGRGTKKDAAAAYKMFSAAAEAGYSDAEYEVGNCYFDGTGTVRNRESAYLRYNLAYKADNNNGKAVFKIGLCNLKGLGVAKNETEAFNWFCKGAEIESPAATYMKGECLFYGVGVEENKAEAAKCFEKALSFEYIDNERIIPSMLAMANCCEKGLGILKNGERALNLYKQAAEYGDAAAMYNAGRAILSGGAKGEFSMARTFILRAARRGYLPAMLTMGICADEGRGVPKNRDDAKRWYSRAITADIENYPSMYEFPQRFADEARLVADSKIEAQYRLGMLLSKTSSSTQDYIRTFEYISTAAAFGHTRAQAEISKIYVHGGDLKGYYESPLSRPDACFENGSLTPDDKTLGEAMNKLGDAMYDGRGMVKKNEAGAVRCYKTAAELGNADACYSYGWCLRHGVGVRENDAEAVKWLKISADKGNNNACYSYGLCCEEGAGTGIKNKREALSYYRKAAYAGHAEAMQRYILLSDREE